jgi:mRNA interferase RelE/StbE
MPRSCGGCWRLAHSASRMADEAYRLSLAPAARLALTEAPPVGLPAAVAAAVRAFVTGILLERPRTVGRPLIRELAGYHSARRGAYRVVHRIDDRSRVVHVVRIDRRADAYHT